MSLSKKNAIERIRTEWKNLWQERLDDKIRAEGVATNNYCSIFVEKGTIIHATKDYKALNLKEIIKQHEINNPDRHIPPNPNVGGWGKFIKTKILSKSFQKKNRKNFFSEKKINNQRSKKCGRGWLHK
ncbi:MAG: hypothetical protein ACW99L_06630 [Promethearchaeota archaeon]|jgi:hypothetical protein